MSEARRPPRPAVRREPASTEASRPRSSTLVAGEKRPTSATVERRGARVEPRAESEELARPWRRVSGDGRARGTSASTEAETTGASRDAASRVSGLLRRGATQGRQAAATQLGTVSTRLQERLRERAAAQRRLSAMVWARRAGYVAVAALLGWVVLASPVLALDPDQVDVTGYGTVVDPQDVAVVVDGYEGRSLATLATSRLADDLRDIQGVRDASIERVWPRGLLVELTSREPVAAVPVDGGFEFLDAEATRVGRADETPADLPVVTVPVGEDHVRVLSAVLGVVNELPVDLRDRVRDISATTEDTVTFTLRDGPRVEWGSAEDSALKARVLQVLLDSGQAEGAKAIDVSAPTLPTTTN